MSSISCPEGVAYSNIASRNVRLSVYIQAASCMWPFAVHVLISVLSLPETRAMTVFSRWRATLWVFYLTGAVLLIASYADVGKGRLSPFHAIVVLNFCWIIFISNYFNRIATSGAALMAILVNAVSRTLTISEISDAVDLSQLRLEDLLGFVHLFGTAILGLLLFHDVRNFAHGGQCPDDTVLWTFGHYAHIVTPSVHRIWLAVYSLMVFPVLNSILIQIGAVVSILAVLHLSHTLYAVFTDRAKVEHYTVTRAMLETAVIPTFLLVMLIISTEKTVSGNHVQDGGTRWTFVRVLPLLALLAPLYDIIRDIHYLGGLWYRVHRRSRATRDLESSLRVSVPYTKNTAKEELSKAYVFIRYEFGWFSRWRDSFTWVDMLLKERPRGQ